MKAAVLEAVGKINIKDIPAPKPGPGEILIQIACCGVCSTDAKLYKGTYQAKLPIIMGHEFSGQVSALGPQVQSIQPGDRVVIDPNTSCGVCSFCRSRRPCFCPDAQAYGVFRNGGFAEYCVVKADSVYKIPDGLSYEISALAEPVSCCVHCIQRAQIQPKDSVAILGAGFAGQILVQLARSAGVKTVIAISRSQWKLDLALHSGATHAVSAATGDLKAELMSLTDGEGVDVVIEAVGKSSTIEQALSLTANQGRVVIFGLAGEDEWVRIHPFEVLSKELSILGAWLNPYTFQEALALLTSGQLDIERLITHRLALAELKHGLDLLSSKPRGFLKAVMTP